MKPYFIIAILMYCICFGNYSVGQTNSYPDSVLKVISTVENSLGPLVQNEGMPLWNLEKQMEKYNIPGLSIAVVRNYKIDWVKGYGVLQQGSETEVNSETVFQAASMSKFVNALTTMHLVEQKQFSLDEDINELLISWEFPGRDSTIITLRQLLSHTAGVVSTSYKGYKNSKKLPSILNILNGKYPANSKRVIAAQAPNQSFMYSGSNTSLAQLILMDQAESSY